MIVAELIELLKTFPPGLPVVYQLHSEQCMLEENDIYTAHLCVARPDGWVQNRRPDMPTIEYLVLPGN